MVDALVGTEMEKAALRAATLHRRGPDESANRRFPQDEAKFARQRADEAHSRALQAAARAAAILEASARLHERVARLEVGGNEDSARRHRKFADDDRLLAEQKRHEALGG